MSDQDFSPRAARHLRGFGRRRVDGVDDERAPADDPFAPAAGNTAPPLSDRAPVAEPLAPGSIWGPQTTASPPSPPPAPERRASDRGEAKASTQPANPKHRRRAGERPPDPDSVDIHAEDSHAWWAQREGLDQAVNPKKRGAAARAQRAAREAFAPSGADHYAHNPDAKTETHNYSWDPSAVYSWGDQAQSEVPPAVPVQDKTPWEALGLTSEASWAEVTKRHRLLAKQHHPDRHSGSGDEARTRAEQRMAEINAAFADLRKIYRLTDGI